MHYAPAGKKLDHPWCKKSRQTSVPPIFLVRSGSCRHSSFEG
jgi:hypothetical protein